MTNLNIFGRDWRENLKNESKQAPLIIDHETGKILSEKKIHEATLEAWLKVMEALSKRNQGL